MKSKDKQINLLHCIWCGDLKTTTDDHVFPRSLGGTKELSIPACTSCQKEISQAEIEVARRSIFALYRFDKGPTPRKKNRPDSGIVEAHYIFVKDEYLGGYAEVGLRSGQSPITLPSIEIDIKTKNGRKRGAKSEDIDKLVNAVLKTFAREPNENGEIGSIDVDLLTETEAQFINDPDWWPRIILDLRGILKVRARSGEECEQFLKDLLYLISKDVLTNHQGWKSGEISAGTPHQALMRWKDRSVERVVTKIAISTIYLKAPLILNSVFFPEISLFIRGRNDIFSNRVRLIHDPGRIAEWPNHHLALMAHRNNSIHAVVVLSGACFMVDFTNVLQPELFSKPIVAMSHRNGISTFFVSDTEAAEIARKLNNYIVS